MNGKKLNPSRSDNFLLGFICCLAVLIYGAIAFYCGTPRQDCIFLLFFIIMAILSFAAALRQHTYYMFMPDGICVYKRPDILLATLPWHDVYYCAVMRPNRRSNYPYYLVLILKGTATLNGKPAASCSGTISDRAAKKYLLHRAAERLARKQITTGQFLQQDVYLIPVTEDQLKQARKLWLRSE